LGSAGATVCATGSFKKQRAVLGLDGFQRVVKPLDFAIAQLQRAAGQSQLGDDGRAGRIANAKLLSLLCNAGLHPRAQHFGAQRVQLGGGDVARFFSIAQPAAQALRFLRESNFLRGFSGRFFALRGLRFGRWCRWRGLRVCCWCWGVWIGRRGRFLFRRRAGGVGFLCHWRLFYPRRVAKKHRARRRGETDSVFVRFWGL